VARTESEAGLKAKALQLLARVEFKRPERSLENWRNGSLLAQALYEAGEVVRSREVLAYLFDEFEVLQKDDRDLSARLGTRIETVFELKEFDPLALAEIIQEAHRTGRLDTKAVALERCLKRIQDAVRKPNKAGVRGTAITESGDSIQARHALRLAWKKFHLNTVLGNKIVSEYSHLSEIGQGLAKAGDLRAARYVAEDIEDQISRLRVFVSVLEASRQ
jgi:hypothetical protein